MEYIHVRNLEKYHPGYKDRTLQWAKIYINMADGDPDTELIQDEIDWARLIKMILLELRAQKPLPNIPNYWDRKGFDLKKRPMSLTIKMLHNFLESVPMPVDFSTDSDTQRREEKSKRREDKEGVVLQPPVSLFNLFRAKAKNLPLPETLTPVRMAKCRLRLKERSLEEWGVIFARLDSSRFCQGDNNQKWRADFDWIIKNEENAVKVLEGKYDNRTGGQTGDAELDKLLAEGAK